MKERRRFVKRRAIADDVAIGQKLRALRLDRGLSQSDLGKMIDLTFQQLQKYENGANRISAGRLLAIAAALKVPVTAFYGAAAARESDRGFAYLRSAAALRLVRAVGPFALADARPSFAYLTASRLQGIRSPPARN